jgi:uncharacterized membrane protein YeiB
MKRADYRIMDEPSPTALEQVIVNPIWPFFASMFAGAWLAYPWFVLNSFALGGKRRYADLLIALGGMVASVVLLLLIDRLGNALVLTENGQAYAWLGAVGLRLGIVYLLFLRQETLFSLYTHFGGRTRNAALLVFAGYYLRPKLLAALPPMLEIILS